MAQGPLLTTLLDFDAAFSPEADHRRKLQTCERSVQSLPSIRQSLTLAGSMRLILLPQTASVVWGFENICFTIRNWISTGLVKSSISSLSNLSNNAEPQSLDTGYKYT